ncbi:MAG: hypothetical protein ACLU30_09680 [Odoribacter splanchnicus]
MPATNPLVWFLIQENEQSLPWTHQVVRTGPDGTKDTRRILNRRMGMKTWSTKQSGLYTFTMADAWCPEKEFTQRQDCADKVLAGKSMSGGSIQCKCNCHAKSGFLKKSGTLEELEHGRPPVSGRG